MIIGQIQLIDLNKKRIMKPNETTERSEGSGMVGGISSVMK